MDVPAIIIGGMIVLLLAVIAISPFVSRKEPEVESSQLLRDILSKVEQLNISIASNNRLTDSQHQELRQILTLLGTQVQQIATIVHRSGMSIHNHVSDTQSNNVTPGE